MSDYEKTIAALSTPPGKGGIGSIRISGRDTFRVVSELLEFPEKFIGADSHRVIYGKISDKQGKPIDEVLVLKMKGPSTYTKEDVVEIQCHGNPVVVSGILNMLYSKGVLPAMPGEFTKRAFMNGRIDLSQAEAVMDLINSSTEKSERSALRQLEGRTGSRIREIRTKMIDLLSHMAVTMDYPEYEDEAISAGKALEEAAGIRKELEDLVRNYDTGRILREGLDIAVIGPPNAGKSTFINKVTGEEKAIVTHIPGTTRDVLEVHFSLRGFPVVLHDTAGIRETDDFIERIGIEKSRKTRDKSHVILMMLDASRGLDAETKKLISESNSENTIYAINKVDAGDPAEIREYVKDGTAVSCSLLNDRGTEEILEAIYAYISGPGAIEAESIAVTNQRHKRHIDKAMEHMSDAIETGSENRFLDLLSVDISHAAEELGKITGENAGEDVIDNIFRKFCVGK